VCSQVTPIAAQDRPAPALPEFEVASIKPVVPGVSTGPRVYTGGRVVINGLTLKGLVTVAFRLSYWQISGGDAWIGKNEYRVEAKPAENLRSSIKDFRYTNFDIEDEHLREMLQALVIGRFQLKFHRETRTGDVCLLERSGKTLRLVPLETASTGAGLSTESSSFGSIGYAGGIWNMSATSMPQLARFAGDFYLHAPVLDRTELSGLFHYRQRVPDMEPNYTENTGSFLYFISELGLKLERTKGPVEYLVIDHAAKPSLD
jgi:uncharacterized protein (TIGR03435 family)